MLSARVPCRTASSPLVESIIQRLFVRGFEQVSQDLSSSTDQGFADGHVLDPINLDQVSFPARMGSLVLISLPMCAFRSSRAKFLNSSEHPNYLGDDDVQNSSLLLLELKCKVG